MKIGLLHLSDIHISNEDIINELIPKMQIACHFELNDIIKLYIVVTGDIVNSGKDTEYTIAISFFKTLQEKIMEKNNFINSIKFIIVPGNHDCLVEGENPVRDTLLQSIKSDDVDLQIANVCIAVQDNFWTFHEKLCGFIPDSKMSYQIEEKLSLDISLFFNCYNSSWMSIKHEVDNNKIIPISSLLSNSKRSNDIVVSLYHHPTSWFSPHTSKNNKKIFEDHLLQTSNIVLCGHEHSVSNKKVTSLKGNHEFVYLEGGALKEKSGRSAFKFICFDTDDFSGNVNSYELKNGEYLETDNSIFKLSHSRNDVNIDDGFYEIITNIKIPIKHPNVEKLTLPDIFIYPDLEPLIGNEDFTSRKIKDALDLLDFKNEKILIEGDSQSGRTSLLYAYYYKLFKTDYFPLYIKGKDLKNSKVKDIIKQCIKQQYRKPFTASNYIEKDISKRVILIDDIDKSALNEDGKTKLLEELEKEFSKIIITTKEANEVHTFTENTKLYSDFKFFRIKPFGYYKRNQLIELWLKLGLDENTLKSDEIAASVKNTFDTISGLLGEQLIPSYPVFILSLLQSLDNQLKPFNVTETSYAYCYHSLILLSLVRVGVSNSEVGGLFNFLTEFSYFLYEKKTSGVDKTLFVDFYNKYTQTYTFEHSLDETIRILIHSNILKEDDDFFYFFLQIFIILPISKKNSLFCSREKGT